MALYMIVILALIQGITEFLPISSSGHLVIAHGIMNPPTTPEAMKANLLLDIAVHVGTLLSVLVYFRKDVLTMACGALDIVTGKVSSDGARLDLYVLVSSIPVILVGLAMSVLDIYWGDALMVIAATTLGFGVLLWVVDVKCAEDKTLAQMSFKDALLIGLAQAIALVPGTSRSGITMTAARALGYGRTESAHYSLLLAIIAIAGAGTLGAKDLIEMGDVALGMDALIAAALAFISGWAAIALMMKWLEKASFKVFAIYRIVLGLALFGLLFAGIL